MTMRRFILAVCLLAAACATAESREERVKREIRATYDQLEQAFDAMNADKVISFRDPSLITIGPDGRSNNYEQMAEYTRRWFTTNKPPIKVQFKFLSVDVKSDDEVAVTNLQEAWRYQDLAGKRRENHHTVVQTETWRRTPAGWKMVRVDNVHDQKRWIDGKRVDPTKPYDPDAPEFKP